MSHRDVVGAGRHAQPEPGNVRRVARQIAAHVGDDIEIEREEAPLVVEREFCGRDIVAAVAVAEKMFAAVGDPFHRLAQLLRRHRGQRVFAIGKQFGAEAAADVGRDDAHLLRRQFHHRAADDVADDVAALAAERQRVAVAVVFGDHAAGVHVVGDEALVDNGQRHRARGLRESLFGRGLVADRCLEGQIAGLVGPDLRRAGFERGNGADHMRQRLPVDGDGFGSVFGGIERVADDEGDGIADMTHGIGRQDRIMRHLDRDVRQYARRWQRTEMGNIGGGEHQPHALHGADAVEIGDRELGMGVRRAQHDGVQRLVGCDIGNVASGAAQQRVVFLAREGLAEAEFHGGHSIGLPAGCGCLPARLVRNAIQRDTT